MSEIIILNPHGNRRKVFPYAHNPLVDYIDHEILVTNILGSNKSDIYKIFQEDPDQFRSENIKLGSALQSLFKNNILFLCDLYGISQNDLFRHINSKGVKGNSKAFLNGNGRKHFSLLYMAQFSRIFRVEAGVLVGVDLREMYKNLREMYKNS